MLESLVEVSISVFSHFVGAVLPLEGRIDLFRIIPVVSGNMLEWRIVVLVRLAAN